MSKLQELINELCPDGVEYRKTSELCIDKFWLMPATPKYIEKGIPYLTSKNIKNNQIDFENVNYISENDYMLMTKSRAINKGDLLITMIGTIGEAAFVKTTNQFYGQNLYLLRLNSEAVVPMFYYYYLTSRKVKDGLISKKNPSSQGYIKAGSIDNLLVPVPPLSVQEEIVRILDKMTGYVTELKAELEAELKARKMQYEYYTQHLLVNADGLECKLGDVATLKTGRKPEKILEEETSYEYINAGTSSSGYVDGSNCDGDTTTTPSRGQGGIGFVGYQKNNFWLGPLCYRIKSKDTDVVLNKFIYFYLKCFPELILQYKKEGGTPSVNASDLVNIPIIIPDIKEQKRIISVLSYYETICTDISIGLPAEIETRQKQYEYYRDKLLSFKETSHDTI